MNRGFLFWALCGEVWGISYSEEKCDLPWWHHDMETLSLLLALCEGNPPVTGGFPSQRASNMSFDVFFDVTQNELLNK